MTGKQPVQAAMRHQPVDRVPVMCQLAIGHYLLNTDVKPAELWFTSEGFARALITLARRYRFDGVLINLPGRDPGWMRYVERIETAGDGSQTVFFVGGDTARCPADDNVQHFPASRPSVVGGMRGCHTRPPPRVPRRRPTIDEVDPQRLYYDDPYCLGGLKYPFYFGLEPYEPGHADYWPDYWFRTIDLVLAEVGEQLSVHGEIFSPFTQLLELFGYEQALMYLIDEPDKCRAILAAYAQGAADLGARQARRGVDAVLISSAFAGGGFISPRQYRHFVLPYEAEVVGRLLAGLAEVKVTATFCLKGPQGASHKRWLSPFPCGDIGDRLELMAETGIDGIDTLDPPPLGSVDLEDAKRRVGDRVFFKGNIDPLGTLLTKPRQEVREDALWRLKVGSRRGGYILSSACSVSPRVKVTATFCLKGPQGAPHKRWLSPFPTVLVEASEGFGTPKT